MGHGVSKSLTYTVKPENITTVMNEIWQMVQRGLKGGPVVIALGRLVRSLNQNARMWAVLKDIAEQVEWHGQYLSDEDWKHIFSATLENQRAVPGINGGFVILGVSTRNKSKEWFSNLFELINAFGAERHVRWSDPALEAFEHYARAS